MLLQQKDKQLKEMEEELESTTEFKVCCVSLCRVMALPLFGSIFTMLLLQSNRIQYLNEVDNLKQLLDAKKKKHKEKIQRLEHKYYAEKVKLQREFASKLAELRKTFHEVRDESSRL